MNHRHLALLLLLLPLLPACKAAGPSDTVAREVNSAAAADPGDQGPGEPSFEAPAPLRQYVQEWLEIGLNEEQIRGKVTEGQEAGHFVAFALTDEDAQTLKDAGLSDEFVSWLKALDLPKSPAGP